MEEVQEVREEPIVGQKYKGCMVVSINEEKSTRPSGLVRIRKLIELDTGVILLEDEFHDRRKIEGVYRELEYKEVPSPKTFKSPERTRSKSKKKPKPPPLLVDPEETEKQSAEEAAKREAEELARKEEEKRALKLAQELAIQKEAELRRKKEEEERAQKLAEEKRAWEEEQRRKAEEEEAEKNRLLQEERLRASQEAARKRKEEADRRREEARAAEEAAKRRAAIVAKWQPETIWVHSPLSKIPRKDGTSPGEGTKALWKFAPGQEEDPDFDCWAPKGIIVFPPGKNAPSNGDNSSEPPCGFWGYAPGTAPDDEGDEWNPKGGTNPPEIWVFAPGEKPSEDDGFKLQGMWMYPPGDTNYPPIPTPKDVWEPKSILVHPKSKPPTETETGDGQVHGTWKVYAGGKWEDIGDEEWRVAEIQVYPEGKIPEDLDDNQIKGLWGLAPGCKPDDEGEWKASDLWFFGPGDAPPDDEWNPQGMWTHAPESGREDWPPLTSDENEEAKRRAAIMENWQPETMWVHSPTSNLPRKDGSSPSEGTNALWKFSPGNEDPDFDWWAPQSVIVHPPGKDASNATNADNPGSPHGYWAYAPGTAPADDEEWNPRGGITPPEIWVYAPGEKPSEDDGIELQGMWTYPPGETNYPPLPTPKNEWEATSVLVHPKSKPPLESADDGKVHGTWKAYDGDNTVDMGDEEWRVAEIQVYIEGKVPDDLNDTQVQGVWGLAPGAKPDDDGEWKASDLWFFEPGDAPPDDEWKPQGVWVHAPASGRNDWPPLEEPADEWDPHAIWVYPPSKLPEDEDEDWQPRGVWNDTVENAELDPCQVTVHPWGQEPDDLDSFEIHGIWGLSPGAVRGDDGHWNPSDIWFVSAGEEPPEDWRPQGVWTVSPEQRKLKPGSDMAKKACVYPAAKVPEKPSKSMLTGVWKYGDGSDADPAWMPLNVLVYDQGAEPENLEESAQHGICGYGPGAEPDEEGNYDPAGLWFFLPGESPPEDDEWNPRGTWTVVPGKANVQLPPPKRHSSEPRVVGKLPKKEPEKPKAKEPSDVPRLAWVFPKKKAPREIEKGVGKGVWSYTPGKKVMDAGKKPTQVQLHSKGKEPDNLPRMHGHWGYAPGAQPNAEGEYLPEDMWLFAPGETPPDDDEWQPQGIWTEPPAAASPVKKKSANKSTKAKVNEPKKGLERRFPDSVWVHPSKEEAPAKGEKDNAQGCWVDCPGGAGKEAPQELMVYAKDAHIENFHRLPHGFFGYAPGSKPDENGIWSPKDMLFYAPGTDPPDDLQEPGIWTYPHGSRTEISTWYKYDGDDLYRYRKTEIFYMDTVTSFTAQFKEP